ncbi:MAG TPA: hypothetical protein DCQ04_03140, partial [Actinobacteria bacterium]|nr:hypothetical protein [Actinomycetota bacterium]
SPRDAFAAAVGRAPEGQLSATAIEQQWNQNAGQRILTRTDDRIHQRVIQWWTQRQAALPPRIAATLHGHHHQVIALLTNRIPAAWELMVQSAASVTDWDQRGAANAFLDRLAVISSHPPGSASGHAASVWMSTRVS